jgi:hypothetical protein
MFAIPYATLLKGACCASIIIAVLNSSVAGTAITDAHRWISTQPYSVCLFNGAVSPDGKYRVICFGGDCPGGGKATIQKRQLGTEKWRTVWNFAEAYDINCTDALWLPNHQHVVVVSIAPDNAGKTIPHFVAMWTGKGTPITLYRGNLPSDEDADGEGYT